MAETAQKLLDIIDIAPKGFRIGLKAATVAFLPPLAGTASHKTVPSFLNIMNAARNAVYDCENVIADLNAIRQHRSRYMKFVSGALETSTRQMQMERPLLPLHQIFSRHTEVLRGFLAESDLGPRDFRVRGSQDASGDMFRILQAGRDAELYPRYLFALARSFSDLAESFELLPPKAKQSVFSAIGEELTKTGLLPHTFSLS